MDVDKFADFLSDCLVEVKQILIFLLEEQMQVVSVIFEKRTLAIGTLQGIPMDTSPLVVVADAEILDELAIGFWLLAISLMFYGNGECLHAIGSCNDAAVAIGLFLKGVVLLYETMVVAIQLLVPLYRAKVSGLQ